MSWKPGGSKWPVYCGPNLVPTQSWKCQISRKRLWAHLMSTGQPGRLSFSSIQNPRISGGYQNRTPKLIPFVLPDCWLSIFLVEDNISDLFHEGLHWRHAVRCSHRNDHHRARFCSMCPEDKGESWCNGDCEWDNNNCVLKKIWYTMGSQYIGGRSWVVGFRIILLDVLTYPNWNNKLSKQFIGGSSLVLR